MWQDGTAQQCALPHEQAPGIQKILRKIPSSISQDQILDSIGILYAYSIANDFLLRLFTFLNKTRDKPQQALGKH